MELHCHSSYGEHIQADEIFNPVMVTLLGEDAGRLVGYAQLRWDETPDCISAMRPGETQRLHVIESWHGKGVSQELTSACIEEVNNMNQRQSGSVSGSAFRKPSLSI